MLIVGSNDFSQWRTINDTIMGGSSSAACKLNSRCLCLEGNVVEENGGFISCRSPVISPPIDLSGYLGIEIDVEGQGLKLKFAISCADRVTRISDFVSGGIRWVAEFETKEIGNTLVKIPFANFRPTIRAKPISFSLNFPLNSVQQFQLLYSKFGTDGELNTKFKSGPFSIIIRSINVYS